MSKRKPQIITFGVVSDTHLCGEAQRLDALSDFYEWVSGYTNKVYHAGDVTDGIGVYRGQDQHLLVHGADNQVEYTVKNYPLVKGLETRVIAGNHDLRIFERAGTDVVGQICRRRKDMTYLGRYKGVVNYPFGPMWVVHPAGGGAYSISYGAQKYVRGLHRKPRIIIFGHRHQKAQFKVEGVECFEAGCFQDENDFTIRRGLIPALGGWLIDIKYNYGKIKEITAIFKEYPLKKNFK